MAVYLEFLNLVIPKSVIDEKYPGGWEQCLADGRGTWNDEYLLREGAMSPMDIEILLDSWKRKGLQPTKRSRGEIAWRDLCIIQTPSQSPTLPCDWIEIAEDGRHAWLKGRTPGAIVGPVYDDPDESDVLKDD